jgi:hypothetical protein
METQQRLYRVFSGIVLICIMLAMYVNMNSSWTTLPDRKMVNVNESSTALPIQKRGPPYLAYVVSAIPKRLNSTIKNLQEKIPGFFDIRHKQSVSYNDSRILRTGDMKVSSLLLSYIDLWSYFGSRPECEFTDNDWIFLFEDDVDIVPMSIIERFHPKLYEKWNYSSPSHSLAGRKSSQACSGVVTMCGEIYVIDYFGVWGEL